MLKEKMNRDLYCSGEFKEKKELVWYRIKTNRK